MHIEGTPQGPYERDAQNLSNSLFGDFYQTFRLAQNEYNVQLGFFHLLGQEYQLNETPEALASALAIAGTKVGQLAPPPHHLPTSQKDLDNSTFGFRAMWNGYEAAIQDPRPIDNAAVMLLFTMLSKDHEYQRRPRPNSRPDEQHMSIVRQHILGNDLAGSAELKSMQHKLRLLLLASMQKDGNPILKATLPTTAKAWEVNHPGQSFMELG